MTDSSPHSTSSLGRLYGVDGNQLARQYRTELSEFSTWSQRSHAQQWLLFAANLGPHLSLDETSLSHGELYTILTNKAAKGGQGSIVAIIAGTKADTVIEILRKLLVNQRKKVKEITLDMASNMGLIAKKCFPQATQVTDRFHVQQLALAAVQDMRIQYRWLALEAENEALAQAKLKQIDYQPELLSNGDTLKQLLARSRYILYKKTSDWTPTQRERASLLFERYPDLKTGYELSQSLSHIFEHTTDKLYGLARLAKWHEKVRQAGRPSTRWLVRSRTTMNRVSTTLTIGASMPRPSRSMPRSKPSEVSFEEFGMWHSFYIDSLGYMLNPRSSTSIVLDPRYITDRYQLQV